MHSQSPSTRELGGWAPRLIVALPELAPIVIMGLALPAMLLLVLGQFIVWLAIVLGVLGAVAAGWAYLRWAGREPVGRADLGWSLLMLALVVGWIGLNARWSAQDVYVTRDPATYGLAGRWLVDHHSLHVPAQFDLFGWVRGLDAGSAGVGNAPGQTLYLQGNHGVSVLLAMAYHAGGASAFFRVNLVLGGASLLALYGLARRFVPGWLACAAPAALGVSLPMLYVSRDTYSEPLCLLFLLGGVLLFWRAVERDHVGLYALTGLVLGASALARLDSYASLLALPVALTVLCATAAPEQRRRRLLSCGVLAATCLVGVVIGYRDVTDLSYGYYASMTHTVHSLGLAAVGLTVAGALVVVLCWRTSVLQVLSRAHVRRNLGLAIAGLTGLVYVGFATWPLWSENHDPNASPATASFIAALQRSRHLAVDPTRTYREYAVTWQGWNYGWPLVVLAGVGLVLLVWRLVTARERTTLLFVLTLLGMSLLYFYSPQIVPDQTWAMRRYIPVVIPGLLVAAVYAIWQLRRLPRRLGVPVMAGLGIALVVVPAVITSPMYRVREDVPELALVRQVCGVLPSDAAVVVVEAGARSGYLQTLRSWCDVPAISLIGATSTQLVEVRTAVAKRGKQLWAFSLTPDAIPAPAGTQPVAVTSITATRWPNTLQIVPQLENVFYQSAFIGPVAADGTVRTVTGS